MTVRLPVPGSDDGTWGNVLNTFLLVAHNGDGTLKGTPNTTLASDTDVAISSPADKQILTYDSTSSKWKNQTSQVTSVAGKTGAVTLAEGDVANLTTDLAAKATDSAVVHKGDLVFNIVDYGATKTATDNKTAIDAAITAAASAGGQVFIPPGTWKTTGGHVIPLNVSLHGAGKGVTTILHFGVGTYCFFIGSNSGGPNPPSYMGRVGDFTLTGQSSGNGTGSYGQQIGISVLNCLFFNLQDIHLTLLYEAVLVDGGDETAHGAGTFAGNGYLANITASNVYVGLHVYRWVTDTLYSFVYVYGNSPITSGSIGIWFDTKPTTSTLVNSSVEGLDTGMRISTSRQGLAFINPRLENCNTYVLWENDTWGHTILGGSNQPGIWATGANAGSVTQIARDGWFPATTSLPTASSAYRHAIYRIDGGAGVADGVYICTKDASGNYAWHEITVGAGGGASIPTGDPGPNDQGLKAWTFDPASMGSAGTALTSQRIQYAKVIVPTATTVTGVAIQITGAPTSASNTFFGLYNTSGVQVAVTADVSSSVGSSGAKQLAFSSTYSAAAGTYYVGFVQTGSPAMSLARVGLGSSAAYNLGFASAPYRYNTGATSQTALPASVTLSSVTSASDAYWLALY